VESVEYIQRREAEDPEGSWFTAMTAALERIARSFAGTMRMSFPRIRGLFAAAPIYELAICFVEMEGRLTHAEMSNIFRVRHGTVPDLEHI
jgi:hypothetical protein